MRVAWLLPALDLSLRRDFVRNNVTRAETRKVKEKGKRRIGEKDESEQRTSLCSFHQACRGELQFPGDGIERMGGVRAEQAGFDAGGQVVFQERTMLSDLGQCGFDAFGHVHPCPLCKGRGVTRSAPKPKCSREFCGEEVHFPLYLVRPSEIVESVRFF